MLSEYGVKAKLERALGKPVDEAVWGALVEEQYVAEAQEKLLTVADLKAEYLKRARQAREKEKVSSPSTAGLPDYRTYLLSRLLAKRAERLPLVCRFRRENLPDGVISLKEVASWIEGQAEREGDSDQWRILEYATEEQGARARKVRPGGVLDRLRALSEWLADYFPWPKAQAATFVLTGEPPLCPPIWLTVRHKRSPEYEEVRIVLDVDAETSPAQVAKVYSEARRQVRKGKRNRPLKKKAARLVDFVLNEGEGKWAQKMDHWNGLYPDWRYEELRNFARDYHRAVAKLLSQS